MKIPTDSQLAAASAAAEAAVIGIIGADLTRFISRERFGAIIVSIVTAALNADEPKPVNQPLAP